MKFPINVLDCVGTLNNVMYDTMDVEFVIKIIRAHSFSLHLKDVEQMCGISPH